MTPSCSAHARALAEPLAGSAPLAQVWVLIEQPGPWGRDALTQSHLDLAIGLALKEWAQSRPVRVGLIRRPGHHADTSATSGARTVLIAGCEPQRPWLRTERVNDPRDLLQFITDLEPDLTAITTDAPPPLQAPRKESERVLAVCTNGKRDRCCAVRGRELAADLAARHPGQVWETSHLGGHRFAPTLVSLPDGYLYGGPQAGELTTAACRGRSTLQPKAQAAEVAALAHLGDERPRPLRLTPAGPDHWHVEDPSTRTRLLVTVSQSPATTERAESCRKPPAPWDRLVASVLQ